MIGDQIEVQILAIEGDQVKIGIVAPKRIKVHRAEVFASIKAQNEAALNVSAASLAQFKQKK